MSTPQRKKPSWMDDKDWAAMAPTLDAARDEAAKAAAEKAAKEAETKAKCAAWHAAKPRWITRRVQVSAGIAGNERSWDVEPKYADKQVLNNAKCPYCWKD